MALPKVADSLAGRMETLHLLPLAQCEVQGGRDVREIADIHKLDLLPRLLRALAQVAGQPCNFARLGGQLGIDQKTAMRYLAIFEHLYLLRRIPVWSGNELARIVKTPRFQFIDSGLLAALTGATPETLARERGPFGRLLEIFVFGELLKMISWSDESWRLSYYRDHDQYEVDFVIENAAGGVVGIEVKAGATVRGGDLGGLRKLAGLAGKRFVAGIVLYDGEQVLPMGEKLWLVPLSALWL